MDLKSYSRWYDFPRARDVMFQATDTSWAPWKRARLNVILHLLHHIPYAQPEREKVKLSRRHEPDGYVEPEYPYKTIADVVGSTPARGAPTRFDTDRPSPTVKKEIP